MEQARYLSELSHCVRCGTCKAFCPTYNGDSMETMGARGRLALLWGLSTGRLPSSPGLIERIFSCTLCGACSGLCPAGLDIKEIIYHGRALLRKKDAQRRFLRFFTKLFANRPSLSFKLLTIARPVLFPYLTQKGLLPVQPDMPGHRLKDNPQVIRRAHKKGRIAVFTGCTVNMLSPQLGESLIHVLHLLGYEVILPAGEVCCGAPLRALGLEDEAIRLARKNLGIFSKLNVKAVLSLCPTCTLTITHEYKNLIGEGVDNAVDMSMFLVDKTDLLSPLHTASHLKKALYHDPCHLKYGLGIEKEPREIIRNIGMDLIETWENRCCGFAGLFCLSFQKLSRELLNNCVQDYMKSDADMIITSCPGCIMQLKTEVKNKPVMHLIEVLEETLLQKS